MKSLGAGGGGPVPANALERLVRRVPRASDPEAFAGHLARVSEDLLNVPRPLEAGAAVHWARRKARVLGLDPARLGHHLERGLAQTGSLGPDEAAEYRRNLATLLPGSARGSETCPPEPAALYAALCALGSETVRAVRQALGTERRVVVFLGTDAEFLKLSYDVWRGSAHASRVFYMSRLSLLGDAERRVLARTRHEVFGADGLSDTVSGGGRGGRHFAWMDNGLVASQLFLLISAARERAAAGEADFGELFTRLFRQELADGRGQAERRSGGPLTLFGTAHPLVDEVLGHGIDQGLFAQRCGALARRFRATAGQGSGDPVIVDIGANGTQPCLLLGALTAGHALSPSVLLFTSPRRSWGPDSPAFRGVPVTGRFAMAAESMKSYRTDYRGALDGAGGELAVVPPDQQLLAFFKQLAFHRAAVCERGRTG
ncbi:hypothetical protein DTL70_14955 [Streptomyces diacarni]|uniref:Uncharacterized protein n=1 Tax=Streptomyces diacarni TaxID=2800381 RepID=A0A367EXW8_9ACTN|nr:hypothetical protein [Streptomyces diacarni]RCG22996.1 hypothetical protein DTL70_14955 [Streptomyces diacarni]